VAAAALVALGVLGFVPDVTSDATAFAFAGHGSRAMLLGLFRVSILLNLLHVLAGAVGFALARTERDARRFLTGGGTAFLGLWLLGVVKAGGWIPLNGADNWLDLALGVGLIGAGYAAGRPVAAL
jgi:Domain of unknown function (DUF4383)